MISSLVVAAVPDFWRFSGGHHDDPSLTPKQEDADSDQFPDQDGTWRVELWADSGQSFTRLLAVTFEPSIGFAAYFGALRDYPDSLIIMRHKGRVMARSKEVTRRDE